MYNFQLHKRDRDCCLCGSLWELYYLSGAPGLDLMWGACRELKSGSSFLLSYKGINTFIHCQWINGAVTVETFWQFLRRLKKVPCDLREIEAYPCRLMCEYRVVLFILMALAVSLSPGQVFVGCPHSGTCLMPFWCLQ